MGKVWKGKKEKRKKIKLWDRFLWKKFPRNFIVKIVNYESCMREVRNTRSYHWENEPILLSLLGSLLGLNQSSMFTLIVPIPIFRFYSVYWKFECFWIGQRSAINHPIIPHCITLHWHCLPLIRFSFAHFYPNQVKLFALVFQMINLRSIKFAYHIMDLIDWATI